MKPKIYIDGKDGTTGLQIYDRLSARSDIDLLLIDESKRKDPAERKKLLNAADLVFLCLPDAAAVEAAAGDDVCAVMLELVQGEGGVLPLEPAYVQAVKKLCEERDWLLLVDEVQTGVGRTGKLFAFQNDGILPDVASFAKGIAGGLPMSGIMANEKCRAVLTPGTHATTFGGNPICAAAGIAVQEILTDEVLAEVKEKGAYIRAQIEGFGSPAVAGTRGLGLMLGITLNDGYSNKELANKMVDAGLLVLTAGQNVIRLLPPLLISQDEMDKGLAIMKDVLCS